RFFAAIPVRPARQGVRSQRRAVSAGRVGDRRAAFRRGRDGERLRAAQPARGLREPYDRRAGREPRADRRALSRADVERGYTDGAVSTATSRTTHDPACLPELHVRDLGRRPLDEVWQEMRDFTDRRTPETPDEIWFVEHPPVFTLGLNADRAHVLAPGDIPVVQIDRGGQVTYHGPGQVVAYVLVDLRRLPLDVRGLVMALENA